MAKLFVQRSDRFCQNIVAFLKAALLRRSQPLREVPDSRTKVAFDSSVNLYLFFHGYFVCVVVYYLLLTEVEIAVDGAQISKRRHFPSPPSSHFSFVALSPKP